MQILVLGNRIPWPLRDGGALATYQLLEALSKAGNAVTYFSYNTQKHHVSDEDIAAHLGFCEVITVPLNAQINPINAFKNLFSGGSYFLERYYDLQASALLNNLLTERNFDLVQIEGLYSFPLLSKRISWWGELLTQSIDNLQEEGIPVVYRAHNVEHEIWLRLAQNESNWIKRMYLKLQSKRLRKEELTLIKKAAAVVGISQNDCDFFGRNTTKKVHLYLPSVKIALKPEKKIQPDALFHIGSMEWEANVQALQWFLSKIWPRLKAEFPDLIFHVAGKGIQSHSHLFFQSSVVNHGEVADAKEFMKSHGVCVVPLRAGSGIRMKLIEALSLGIPCVATDIAVQGLPVTNEKELMIANDADTFVLATRNLLNNRKAMIDMGKRAHAYCFENHNPTKNTSELIAFYHSLKS